MEAQAGRETVTQPITAGVAEEVPSQLSTDTKRRRIGDSFQEMKAKILEINLKIKTYKKDFKENKDGIKDFHETDEVYFEHLMALSRKATEQLSSRKLCYDMVQEALLPDEKQFFEYAPKMLQEGRFLKLPNNIYWLGRDDLKNAMLVRHSYKSLYECITDAASANEGTDDTPLRKVIITGTPGIGKSFFAYYWLWRRIKDRKKVIIETGNYCFIWSPDFACRTLKTRRDYISLLTDDPEMVYLVDSDSKKDIANAAKCLTIMFSSPRESNFHDFHKNGAELFYLPLWSMEEMEIARKEIYVSPRVSERQMKAVCAIYGPIPRYALQYPVMKRSFRKWSEKQAERKEISLMHDDRLGRAIATADVLSLARNILLEEDPPKWSYSAQLVHLDLRVEVLEKLEKREHVCFEEFQEVRTKWATAYVFRKLTENHKKQMLELAKKLVFTSGRVSAYGSLASHTFEEIGHAVLSSGNVKNGFSVRSLESDDAALDLSKIASERSAVFTYSKLKDINPAREGIYYRPWAKNQASFDSFTILETNLLIFQCCLGNRDHPVVDTGLRALQKELDWQKEVCLIFVVPHQNYEGFRKQKLREPKGKGREARTGVISEIESKTFITGLKQYVLAVEEKHYSGLIENGN